MRDHAPLLSSAPESEEVTVPDPASEDAVVEDGSEPAAKKQKQGPGRVLGRVADGQDFWSQADEWFEEKNQAWGTDYSGAEWTLYVILCDL